MNDSVVNGTVSALKKVATDAVIKALSSKLPFLAGRFVSPIFGWLVSWVVEVLYDQGALAVNWVWINIDSSSELKIAVKTKERLSKILEAGGDYGKAEQEFNEATDDLIRHRFGRLPRK